MQGVRHNTSKILLGLANKLKSDDQQFEATLYLKELFQIFPDSILNLLGEYLYEAIEGYHILCINKFFTSPVDFVDALSAPYHSALFMKAVDEITRPVPIANRSVIASGDCWSMATLLKLPVDALKKAERFDVAWSILGTMPGEYNYYEHPQIFNMVLNSMLVERYEGELNNIQAGGVIVKAMSIRDMCNPVLIATALTGNTTPEAKMRLFKRIRAKRRMIVELKSVLWFMLINAQIVAAAGTNVTMEQLALRQWSFFTTLFGFIFDILFTVLTALCEGVDKIYSLVEEANNDYMLAIVDLIGFMFCGCCVLVLVYKLVESLYIVWLLINTCISRIIEFWSWLHPAWNIKNRETGVSLVGSETIDGIEYYEFMINGERKCLSTRAPFNSHSPNLVVPEMALPGSDLYPSIMRPVGVIMVATDETELSLVGCFFRYEDYLITALHVANTITNGLANCYLSGVKEDKKGRCYINNLGAMLVKTKLFDVDSNDYSGPHDVYAIQLDKTMWAKLQVTKVSIKKGSFYNQAISAVGFSSSMLVTSAGKTLPDSGRFELHHTASTNKGFSGSPLFSGSSVVGMHVAGTSKNNIAIRIEAIVFHLKRNESNEWFLEYYEDNWKWKGKTVDFFEEDEGDFSLVARGNGAVIYGLTRDEVRELFPSRFEETEAEYYGEHPSDAPPLSIPAFKYPQPGDKMRWGDYEDDDLEYESAELKAFRELEPERPAHCNSSPKAQADIEAYLLDQLSELTQLGFEPAKYRYPEINEQTEMTSLKNHLELFAKRNRLIQLAPTAAEINRVTQLCLALLPNNKFEVRKDYKSKLNLIRIMDSSTVKEAKSAGYPYQTDGLMNNGAVLRHYGKDNFAELILREWNSDFQLKIFGKSEPTKEAKLDAGMMRIIMGFPLHKTVKHQAIFENLLITAIDNWMESKIKFVFSPSNPGNIEHLSKVFGTDKVYCSDKKNWDYMFFDWIYSICEEVVVQLATQSDMTDEEFASYIVDVRGAFQEVRLNSNYRCTNGRVFQSTYQGIMKTGWKLTIFVNSLAQLVVDVLIKCRMGCSDDLILSLLMDIVVGGDDVLQKFPNGFDTALYVEKALELGCELEPFSVEPSLDGAEFFSNKLFKRDGIWIFLPERFTKHVAHVATTKRSDLASALGSHMQNHCWDSRKYNFFAKMFRHFRKLHPEEFPLAHYKTMMQLRYRSKGAECGV
jgi:V8-like Glu-specific endopeptidase